MVLATTPWGYVAFQMLITSAGLTNETATKLSPSAITKSVPSQSCTLLNQ